MDLDNVLAALSRMPSGSGTGLDSLHFKHIQDMVTREALGSERRLLVNFSNRLILCLVAGDLNTLLVPFIVLHCGLLTRKLGGFGQLVLPESSAD